MQIDQLKPNVIVTGSIISEPIQVLIITQMGASVKLIGQGLNTNQVHKLILNAAQIAQLQATPDKEPFVSKAAEAKERRLVPEVIDDFFIQAAPIAGIHPKENAKGQKVYLLYLAQALSALYPNGTDEKRWVDGVLARKKGLGF